MPPPRSGCGSGPGMVRTAEVGTVDDFPVGRFRIVQVGRHEIGVIRLDCDEWRAVLNVCPHRGAPVCRGTVGGTWPPSAPGTLEYGREGRVLSCPWHGYEFDLDDGRELFHRDPKQLRLFPVVVDGGRVSVHVPGPGPERLHPRR